MSDLPTRDCACGHPISLHHRLEGPCGMECECEMVNPLLTREEAANDPEVRRMVHDSIAAKWAWLNETEVTDDDIETQTPWKMHDWNLGKGGTDDE